MKVEGKSWRQWRETWLNWVQVQKYLFHRILSGAACWRSMVGTFKWNSLEGRDFSPLCIFKTGKKVEGNRIRECIALQVSLFPHGSTLGQDHHHCSQLKHYHHYHNNATLPPQLTYFLTVVRWELKVSYASFPTLHKLNRPILHRALHGMVFALGTGVFGVNEWLLLPTWRVPWRPTVANFLIIILVADTTS